MFFYCLLNILLNYGLKLLIFIALEEMVGNLIGEFLCCGFKIIFCFR